MPDQPAALDEVLHALDISPAALLGEGGEALVYALDAGRVARINRAGVEALEARNALLAALRSGAAALPFHIPEVLETHHIAGHLVTIERRLPGHDLASMLADADGPRRAALIDAYLDAAALLGDLELPRSPGEHWYGDLIREVPIRRPTWRAYLESRANNSLTRAGLLDDPSLRARLDPDALAAALPEPDAPAFVHLDAFPGNMLAEGDAITAVLDFSVVSLAGDRRLDPLAAVAYLDPEISPTATEADRTQAERWLRDRGLHPLLAPARRWLAAFWSAATDDAALAAWCRRILELPPPPSTRA